VARACSHRLAGWLGLLITGLNLLPIGQLDGGHISRALFGWRLGEKIGNIALWRLVLLAIFVWPGFMMWAIIVFFIAGTAVPPLNDLTPLPSDRRWFGYTIFVILGLILAPLPHSLWTPAGLHCPYL
jgi:membrane-associated protease RseP (regulator of RpoE activity)